MMPSRAAVIDLGTNTFHLLILEWEGMQFRILEKLQLPVKLGKGTFHSLMISNEAYIRGIDAMKEFKSLVDSYEISNVEIYGTSTFRNAKNGPLFAIEAETIIGQPIRTISGDEEAELIFSGVKNAVPLGDQPHLIMDIGGGSVEFIIGNNKSISWIKSYEIGAARLIDRFPGMDPMHEDKISEVEAFLETELTELWEQALNFNVKTLVGASGSFESLGKMERNIFNLEKKAQYSLHHEIDYFHFEHIYQKIISATQEEIMYFPGIPAFRVEMISMAAVMINYVLKRTGIHKIITSDYALKEGVMLRLMEENEHKIEKKTVSK